MDQELLHAMLLDTAEMLKEYLPLLADVDCPDVYKEQVDALRKQQAALLEQL